MYNMHITHYNLQMHHTTTNILALSRTFTFMVYSYPYSSVFMPIFEYVLIPYICNQAQIVIRV